VPYIAAAFYPGWDLFINGLVSDPNDDPEQDPDDDPEARDDE